MKYKIGRAINNITINGNEYVLDDKGKIMDFNSIKKAKEFLKLKGINSFKGIDFEEV